MELLKGQTYRHISHTRDAGPFSQWRASSSFTVCFGVDGSYDVDDEVVNDASSFQRKFPSNEVMVLLQLKFCLHIPIKRSLFCSNVPSPERDFLLMLFKCSMFHNYFWFNLIMLLRIYSMYINAYAYAFNQLVCAFFIHSFIRRILNDLISCANYMINLHIVYFFFLYFFYVKFNVN